MQPARRRFEDPRVTALGDLRAHVSLVALKTLWFNTGSLCNIACDNCYIESSPRNDRLAYLSAAEVTTFLDEVEDLRLPVEEIGFTGGEPFLNRELPQMLRDALGRGHRVIVLTNAMKPLEHRRQDLLALPAAQRDALTLRVSIDHYRAAGHEAVRGAGTWQPSMAGLHWLVAAGFRVHVAGRTCWDEPESQLRAGYADLFRREGIAIDAEDLRQLVLFPEMDPTRSPPEITVGCWKIVGRSPEQMMCATSRMVVKRRGASRPVVLPCTLLPYDPQFELGATLAEARATVYLNHPFCAQFCVLGGASCSARVD
jgi:sulfatase maturation enzyme AslB (radical SAM superfamily)